MGLPPPSRSAILIALLLTALAAAETVKDPGPPAAAVPRGGVPLPPFPPLAPPGPPPADPDPSLFRAPGALADGYLLTLIAEPRPPALKSGRPTTLAVRPHDVIQAPGDPKPIEGAIAEERDGQIWFRDLKGIAHPRNPIPIADLLLLQRQAGTLALVVRQRSERAGANAATHLAIAQDCLDADLPAEAEAELKRAIELDAHSLPARLKLADLVAARGRRDAEVGACEAALAATADAPAIRERLGRRCLELGLFALAADHFARGFLLATRAEPGARLEGAVVPADPAARELLRLAAEARLLGGRREEALATLQSLARATPDDPAVRNDLALAELLAGRSDTALAILRPLAAAPDAPASARNSLGALLFRRGEAEAALGCFEACLAAAPSHAKAAANAALACAALGRLPEARKRLAAIAPPPARSLGFALAAGYVSERLGDAAAAVAAYRQARALDPGSAYAAGGLARALLATGDARAAAAAFDDARLLAPGDLDVVRGLGSCLYRTGQFAAAADAFRPLARRPSTGSGRPEPAEGREQAEPRDLVRLAMALLHLPDGLAEAAEMLEKAVAAATPTDAHALAASAHLASATGAHDQAEDRLHQAQRAADTPELAKFAADALARLAAARGEEVVKVAFGAAGATQLPDGWRATGEGNPSPVVRQDEVRFEGTPAAAAERSIATTVPFATPAEKGPIRRFAAFEIAAAAPLTSDATAGVLLGVGPATLQVALRTTRQPQLHRGLAYRVVRGQDAAATPWTDLPGTVALETLRLGVRLSARAADAVDVTLNGRPVGPPIPLDALRQPPQELTLGVFAAAEPQQQCLFAVREAEIVWKKP